MHAVLKGKRHTRLICPYDIDAYPTDMPVGSQLTDHRLAQDTFYFTTGQTQRQCSHVQCKKI